MKICVSGWYFFPELIPVLAKASRRYPVCFVTYAGRVAQALEGIGLVKSHGLRHEIIPVAGLEFGGYDYYLKNFWDRESPVFFMHDDIIMKDPTTFDGIADLACDQAYVFRDVKEEEANGRMHGRGIYCSKKFLDYMLDYVCECEHSKDQEDKHNTGNVLKGMGPHTGFWYDPLNDGSHNQGKVPLGLRHYNCGIYHFQGVHVRHARKYGLDAGHKVHFWDFESARRGKLGYVRREEVKKVAVQSG